MFSNAGTATYILKNGDEVAWYIPWMEQDVGDPLFLIGRADPG